MVSRSIEESPHSCWMQAMLLSNEFEGKNLRKESSNFASCCKVVLVGLLRSMFIGRGGC